MLDTISKLVVNDSYKVVVVISINLIMEFLKESSTTEPFYNLIDALSGLLVVVSEIPLGKEVLSLGSIEFRGKHKCVP